MNTVNQSKLPSQNPTTRSDNPGEDRDFALSPLQMLMEEANAGGDQHNGAGPPVADELRNPENFATPGPMTSLLSEPLLANPFASVQSGGAQPLFANAAQLTRSTHNVKSGDTLTAIAAANDMSLNELIAMNPQIRNPDMIHPSDQITVLSRRSGADAGNNASSHTVAPGDTLSAIAAQNGVSLSALIAANPQIRNPDLIYPGDVINLPSGANNPAGPGGQPDGPSGPGGPGSTPAPDGPSSGPGATGDFDYNMISGVQGNENITPEFINKVEAMAER